MDVHVTIEEFNGFERVRFEPGIPAVSDFLLLSGDDVLRIQLKGEHAEKYHAVKGTPNEEIEKSRLIDVVTESVGFVTWLKPGKREDEIPF